MCVYAEELFDTIFNMGYGSLQSCPWVRGLNIHRCKEKEIQRVKKNLGMHDICITNLCHRHTPCVPANRFNSTSYFV